MSNLLDIADSTDKVATVEIRGVKVDLVGLTSRDLAKVCSRFAALDEVMQGKRDLTLKDLVLNFPDVVAAMGAMGTGSPDDPMAEEKMASLIVGEQMKILKAIIEESFGEVYDPLLGLLRDTLGLSAGAASGRNAMSHVKSRLPSRDSLRSATTPEMFGATVPGNSPDSPS